MKIGDAVRLRHIAGNHPNRCLRIYNIPRDVMPNVPEAQRAGLKWSDISSSMQFKRVIDKLWDEEIGVILEFGVDPEGDQVRILSPRGIPGWLNRDSLELVE